MLLMRGRPLGWLGLLVAGWVVARVLALSAATPVTVAPAFATAEVAAASAARASAGVAAPLARPANAAFGAMPRSLAAGLPGSLMLSEQTALPPMPLPLATVARVPKLLAPTPPVGAPLPGSAPRAIAPLLAMIGARAAAVRPVAARVGAGARGAMGPNALLAFYVGEMQSMTTPQRRLPVASRSVLLAAYAPQPAALPPQAVMAATAFAPPLAPTSATPSPQTGRWSASAWLLARGGGLPRAQAGQFVGQYGGSQAGLVVRRRVAGSPQTPVQAYARFASPLAERRPEGALGVAWRPLAALPLTVALEQRLGTGAARGPAAGIAGGVSDRVLPAGFRLEAYGQAGVVAGRTRLGYADAAVRIARPLASTAGLTVEAGAGAWAGGQSGGAGQAGVSRLDVGPTVALRIPSATGGLRLSLDWRMRIAGNASPASGPALTLASDF